MKRVILILFLAINLTVHCQQTADIQLDTRLQYGYNGTWENYGTLSAIGDFKLAENFILSAGIDANLANVYSAIAKGKLIFPLCNNMQLHLSNSYLYRAFVNDNFQEFSGALLLGFQMNYFGVSLGNNIRLMRKIHLKDHENVSFITEPFNMLYSIEGEFRKRDSDWNIGLRISNMRQFVMERMYQPMFSVYSYYLLNTNIRFVGEMGAEPAGIFNVAANSYGYYLQLGVQWLW